MKSMESTVITMQLKKKKRLKYSNHNSDGNRKELCKAQSGCTNGTAECSIKTNMIEKKTKDIN